MSVSVIVSNFNGARFLPRLLNSLSAQRQVTLEVIVVDRHSTDGSRDLLKNYSNVVIVNEAPESGLVAGYTAGSRVAKYEHFFFCNEDMWFDEDCLRRLEAQISLESRIASADPWQWSYGGEQWLHGGVRFRRKRWETNSAYPLRKFDFNVPLGLGEPVPFPCAGAFLIHRDVFNELGGWDTSFFLDDEDVDLFIRAWQRGWHCVTVPEARVYHAVGASNEQNLATIRQTVSSRRYISHCSSTFVIGIKYFSGPAALLGAINYLVRFGSNLLRLRLTNVLRDVLVVKEIIRRLPEALEFRSRNLQWNKQKPGQEFFLQPEFQINA
jgi:GT2 family glycosyltransferase